MPKHQTIEVYRETKGLGYPNHRS